MHQRNVRKRKNRTWKRINLLILVCCIVSEWWNTYDTKLLFELSLLPPNEVSDAFTDDIMTGAPASHTAMKFADYVFENYIAVNSRFPPTLWAKPPDLLFPYTNNGTESYHSHLTAEFYVKHPNIGLYILLMYRTEKDSAVGLCFNEQHVTTGAEVKVLARQERVCGCCILW